jgi:hypothetical protein
MRPVRIVALSAACPAKGKYKCHGSKNYCGRDQTQALLEDQGEQYQRNEDGYQHECRGQDCRTDSSEYVANGRIFHDSPPTEPALCLGEILGIHPETRYREETDANGRGTFRSSRELDGWATIRPGKWSPFAP